MMRAAAAPGDEKPTPSAEHNANGAEPRVDKPPDAAAANPQKEIAWSEPVAGLEMRLIATRTEFQSWELPTFVLEVRNNTSEDIAPLTALSLFVSELRRPGLLFLFKDHHRRASNPNNALVPEVQVDAKELIGLKPGQSIKLTPTLTALREEQSPKWPANELTAGRYTIGVGVIGPRHTADLKTNTVTFHILPPGIQKREGLSAFLKPHSPNDQPIEAGFVPNKTTVFWG
jgi:hypothetical protein